MRSFAAAAVKCILVPWKVMPQQWPAQRRKICKRRFCYREYPFELPAIIGAAHAGFQILTLASSPADAKTRGSFGCHETELTQPG